MRTRSPDASDIPTIEAVMRLAVLLAAGVTPSAAWRHLARGRDPLLVNTALAAQNGGDVAAVLRGGGGSWPDIAAVWSVAVAVGAPLADTLRSAVGALRDAAEVRADVSVALAEPLATARLLSWLPLLGLPFGILVGLDPVSILSEPLGGCALIAGLLLVGASRLWTRRLARGAQPGDGIPGWDAELLAVALSSGASIERARALVAAESGGVTVQPSLGVADALDLSVRTGAPAAELLRGEAWLARQRARTRGRESAARLATRLLVPLGVCTLPAFLLLAVAPAVLGVMRSTIVPL